MVRSVACYTENNLRPIAKWCMLVTANLPTRVGVGLIRISGSTYFASVAILILGYDATSASIDTRLFNSSSRESEVISSNRTMD
jgi:hypothetical protein